ncbi:MAG: methyltransferase domain-containing protein [Beijerinckiaceae bacterium]|jgi:protein-L-isoaspartate(D-aspartate) O-methyltransferase|nr:methyltransferase domain-containing protein [Beijerinckiaceae bacterium]
MDQRADHEPARLERQTGASAQATMRFLLRLRERGIANVAVLRALETLPREHFVPHRHADLAWRDIALPIGCGQTMPEPYVVARMMESLDVGRTHRVLEIGAGNGFSAAILSRLAAEVLSVERFQALALAASARLAQLGIDNARIVWGDGLELPAEIGLFDRILVQGVLKEVPASILNLLAAGGVVVFARREAIGGRARLVRLVHKPEGFVETRICECRLQRLIPGVSAAAG